MALLQWLKSHTSPVQVFTLAWTMGSLLASAYFGFLLFPKIYAERTSAVVEVHFRTGDEGSTVYYPNLPTYRGEFLSQISDRNFLYFTACDALPLSQRPICDTSRNWKKVDPRYLGCSDVASCTADTYRLSEEQRYIVLSGARPISGASLSIHDLTDPSLSDPGGWGRSATWPVFFVTLFFSMKLGRTIGEFWFTPYVK